MYQVAVVPDGAVAFNVTAVLPKQVMFSVVTVTVGFAGFSEFVVTLEVTVEKFVPLTVALFVTSHVFTGREIAALIVALNVIIVLLQQVK